jgi:hypothetical protein
MVRFAAVLCLFVAACFNPTFNNPTCGPNGECPSGTTCMNGLCVGSGGDDDGGDFDAIDAPSDDDAIDAPEIIDGSSFAVTFLPASASLPGTGDWIVTDPATLIDTTILSVTPALPAGVTLTTSPQTDGSAPSVAVLHVNRLQIVTGVTLRVIGNTSLVIVAGNEVVLDGILDIGGAQALPGAGGYQPMQGPGSGQPGQSEPVFGYDSGGGGAGYGTPGGRGGDGGGFPGGNGGLPYGVSPPAALLGGSGGGQGAENGCPIPRGGGGGGALLVASATRIIVNGGIRAGGGGGMGGTNCGSSPGGGGGGAGGQIDLQAPDFAFSPTTFVLAANGGGGGGGGNGAMDGFDGLLSDMPAAGGQPGGSGGRGGPGSVLNMPGLDGVNSSNNGGGGGGGGGRITVRFRGTQPSVLASPPATFVTY